MDETDNQSLRVMAFFAHPDDETMFLGGTLAFLAERGEEVHYLCATRGEGGEMGDPPICAREELGEVRELELACAVKELGASSLNFLDYQDPVVGPAGELYPFAEDIDTLAQEVGFWIMRIQPDVIITHGPGGEYGHPAHIQAHEGLLAALDRIDHQPEAVYSPAWLSRDTGEFTPAPGILVETSPWLEKKINAVSCHRSQHDLFIRHGSARAGRTVTIPEMVRSMEALYRILPAEDKAGEDNLARLLAEIRVPAEGSDLIDGRKIAQIQKPGS